MQYRVYSTGFEFSSLYKNEEKELKYHSKIDSEKLKRMLLHEGLLYTCVR
jgi:hypothetical protein